MAVVADEIELKARRAAAVLSRHTPVASAYIFGSHLSGRADEYSDIDLAVFLEGVEQMNLAERARLSGLVHEEVGNDIELHYFPARSLKNPDPASFASFILKNGIQLKAKE